MTFSDVVWDSSTAQNVTISNGTVTGNSTNGGYISNVKSVYSITTGDSIEFEMHNYSSTNNGNFVVGLGTDPFGGSTDTYLAVEFGMHWSNGNWKIYENGSNKGSHSGASNDTCKIYRDGSSIKYYVNNVLKYTSATTTSADLYAQGAFTHNDTGVTMQTDATQSSDPDQTIEIGYDGTPVDPDVTLQIGYDDSSSAVWKWWVGMRYGTRKRYGTNHIRRIKL